MNRMICWEGGVGGRKEPGDLGDGSPLVGYRWFLKVKAKKYEHIFVIF